jgi:hypothetical protein
MKDVALASGISILFALILLMKWRFHEGLQALTAFGRPAASVFILGSVLALFYKGFPLSGLVCALLSVYLLKTVWVSWPRSDEKRLFQEMGRDQARWHTIDTQFGNKTAVHDTPITMVRPDPFPEMLVFPPSSQTLQEMCD